jgi:hypothetical protein
VIAGESPPSEIAVAALAGAMSELRLASPLLKAYLGADRLDNPRWMLSARGRGSSFILVAGSAAVH